MTIGELTKQNYRLLAAKLYTNPILQEEEFIQDLALIRRVVNRLIKFSESGELKPRILLNNFLVARNCFGQEYVIKLMFLMAAPNYHAILYSWLHAVVDLSGDVIVNSDLIIRSSEILPVNTIIQLAKRDIGKE
jgi:hypothetical protein